MNRSTTQFHLLLLLTVCATTGCTLGGGDGWRFAKSVELRNPFSSKDEELAPIEVPTRLVSTWQDATLNRVGESPKRGFGGRLLFFNDESREPVRVDGQLVVYAFDEEGRPDHETQPSRRFVFPAEQFARHESESQIGPSYSVWLPWDEVGGEQKNISLIARFESKAGPLIVGEQTKHLLPGTRRLADGKQAPAVKQVDDIQLTQFTQESKIDVPKVAPQVTSIALAREAWAQRLAKPQAAKTTSSVPASAVVLPGPSTTRR